MKLNLKANKDILTLEFQGEMDAKGLLVIKAGITKLLRDGKNKLILDVTEATKLESDVIRELAVLNITAKELNGEIMLGGVNAELEAKIKNFSKSDVIAYFKTAEEAVKAFEKKKPVTKQIGDGEKGESSDAHSAETSKKLEELEAEIQDLKTKLKEKEGGEIAQIRKDNAHFKSENELFRRAIETLTIERRDPQTQNAYAAKIGGLEAQVEDLLNKLKDVVLK